MTLPWTILQSTEVCSNVWIYRLRSPLPFDSAPGILVSIVPMLEPFQTLYIIMMTPVYQTLWNITRANKSLIVSPMVKLHL